MKGNRLSYEVLTLSGGGDLYCRTITIDAFSWEISYEKGYRPARYNVPAIRQGYEFGTSWPDGKPSLIYWKQERFDA